MYSLVIISGIFLIISSLKFYLDEKVYNTSRTNAKEKTIYLMLLVVGVGGVIMGMGVLKKHIIINKIVAIITIILFFLALLQFGTNKNK